MLLIKMPKNLLELNGIIYELLSNSLNNRYIHYARVSKVHITSLEDLPWSLDGEDGGNIPDAEIIIYQRAVHYICRKVNDILEELETKEEIQEQLPQEFNPTEELEEES